MCLAAAAWGGEEEKEEEEEEEEHSSLALHAPLYIAQARTFNALNMEEQVILVQVRVRDSAMLVDVDDAGEKEARRRRELLTPANMAVDVIYPSVRPVSWERRGTMRVLWQDRQDRSQDCLRARKFATRGLFVFLCFVVRLSY